MKIGERVGAILGRDDATKTVKFFGYGIYEGDEVPPSHVNPPLNSGNPNPKILLESGKVVWGCESWWGPVARIEKMLEQAKTNGYAVVEVDVDEVRKRHA